MIATLVLICGCQSNEIVVCNLFENDRCVIEIDEKISKEFTNLTELSSGINEMTSKYFTFDSIHHGCAEFKPDVVCNAIVFQNFTSNDIKDYTLNINGTNNYSPTIELDCANNKNRLPFITLKNIDDFNRKSSLSDYSSIISNPIIYKDKNGNSHWYDLPNKTQYIICGNKNL